MATAAPRLAVGQLRRGQLPAEVTGFVGRQAELACLASLLSSARLVTVSGPGGVGKTRIAVRAAANAAARYPHGVSFADLAGLRDPSRLAGTVADSLGLRDAADLTAVLTHLRDQRLLLVLDTCEHLVDACATFAEAVLREAPPVTMLITSREPLDVPGEHTLPIPPLPVPGPESATAGCGDAVELFAQRGAAASPSFLLTAETLPHVVRLCRRLDGIPLALELAAVRLRALPLPELADRLEHRFHMLDGGRRGAVPRHQTLRTAIQWSYDLCTPAEQELWARLSVFDGAFAVSAAEYVCSTGNAGLEPGADRVPGHGYSEIMDALIGLVDKSVLLRDDNRGNRYRLPDTLREFGALRLAGTAEEDACRDRHLSYYLAAARGFRDESDGDRQRKRFRELLASHANLRAALEREASGTADGTGTARLATALRPYWMISGRLAEGTSWLDRAIAAELPEAERAGALIARAGLRAAGGQAARGADDARAGIQIAARLGDDRLEARGYLSLHAALTLGGREADAADAAAAGAEAHSRLTAADDDTGLVVLGVQRAHLLQLTGNPEDAIRECERTLRRLRDRGAWWLRGWLHTITALACVQLPGADDRGAVSAVRGLRASYEAGDMTGTAYALEVLAWIAASGGRPERAAWLIGAADPLWERAGARLSGTAIMLEAHQQAATTAADSLGDQRFTALRAHGAACPLEAAVTAAADDADDLSSGQATARGRVPGGWGAGLPANGLAVNGLAVNGPAVPRARQTGLTSREREIAELVGKGLSNREIASQLVISKRTVDAHVEHIFAKLGLSSRVQLTRWLREQRTRTTEDTENRPRPAVPADNGT